MPRTAVVTGANRGLGLEWVRQLRAAGWRVHAGCRHPERAVELNTLAGASDGAVSVHPLDTTEAAHIEALRALLADTPLDLLVNNAGIYGQAPGAFGETDVDRWLEAFRINAIAPLKVLEALADNLARNPLGICAAITSKMGSMADNRSGGSYVYRSSKAALNMVMTSAAVDLKPRGVPVLLLHPGWVRTDMGGPRGEIDVEESVRAMRGIVDRASLEDTGRFFDIDGTVIPW